MLTLVILSNSLPAFAQDGYRISGVIFGSGESPIVSGISAGVQLKNEGGGYMEIVAQEEQAWFMMGKQYRTKHLRGDLYWSVGHLQGAPWVGPYVNIVAPFATIGGQEVSVGVMTWPGFFIGTEPSKHKEAWKRNPETIPVGDFSMGFVNVGPASIFLTRLNFLNTPTNWLPGVGLNKKLVKQLELNSSAMWNSNEKRMMYFVGATWRPSS